MKFVVDIPDDEIETFDSVDQAAEEIANAIIENAAYVETVTVRPA